VRRLRSCDTVAIVDLGRKPLRLLLNA